MSRILSDKDRAVLLKAYKDDRMKDAPANISDKTLIENYGTNEQKKLLSGLAPTESAPKGTENKTSENKGANPEPPANGGNTGSGDGAGADNGSEEDKIKAEKELDYIKTNGINTLYFQDSNYPDRLKHCFDGPVLLFGSGTINFNNRKIISIVGTRQITSYGIEFCKKLIYKRKTSQIKNAKSS